jgi:primosomal protein N' (replication factor Y)
MKYCDIWLKGIKGIFSWHTECEISIGARVRVFFHGRKKGGIVVRVSDTKPSFSTQPIQEIWEEHSIDEQYIHIAQIVADENFSSLEKVLNLMVPEKFLMTRYPEKRETFYQLNPDFDSTKFELLKGKKQKLALSILEKSSGKILAKTLHSHVSRTTIGNLIQKKIIFEEKGKISDIFSSFPRVKKNFPLVPTQKKAFHQIQKSQKPCLLFGVTGSGKTEIYKHLARKTLETDETAQVLFLLPEIALTPQLVEEFHSLFDGKIAMWHSKLSEGEKIQEWARCTSGEAKILIGTRSAVFVPLKNPKLIILDEEHEWTFKNEFSPRFQTHDVVELIGQKMCSKLVFGTATPRLESFYKCKKNEWKRVDIPSRIHAVQLPKIQFIDLKNEAKKGNFTPFSDELLSSLSEIMKQKKQAVIFLNKRGFSGSTLCRSCGHKFHCPHCANNMKMHQKGNVKKFICHICGHMELFPTRCPECHVDDFVFRGWGTQMVEKKLSEMFPQMKIIRADADSITRKHDFKKLIEQFHSGKADVLLGTQMVAKGLDFENVDLVGVILADVGLNVPDFRAEERVFQILTQVSGRAGRRRKQGKIVIQTFHPNEKVFEFIRCHDGEGFLEWQLHTREKTCLPPFSIIGKITVSDIKKEKAFTESKRIFEHVKKQLLKNESSKIPFQQKSWNVFMAPAFFPRTYGKYHFHIFIRAPDKEKLLSFLKKQNGIDSTKIDITPISLL